MRGLIIVALVIGICTACSDLEEGLIGEWEGEIERINSEGDLIEASTSCVIKSISGTERNVVLIVAGTNYSFIAHEEMNALIYKDIPLGSDSIVRLYISGMAELMNDTLLHFDHQVYATKNNALLYSDKFILDMTRK